MKTSTEIVAYLDGIDSTFGWENEVLITYLPYEYASKYLKEEVSEQDWDNLRKSPDMKGVDAEVTDYLGFAFGKAEDHRGISAGRSVDKMRAYLWYLCLDVEQFDAAGYAMYGVPKLMVAAQMLGYDPPDNEATKRMGRGLPCRDNCDEGC